ncbi:MAG: hypothetical protein ACTSVU_07415 [Promethearchaeota archaeon]
MILSSFGLLIIIGNVIFGLTVNSLNYYLNSFYLITIVTLPVIFLILNIYLYQKTEITISLKLLTVIEILLSILLLLIIIGIFIVYSKMDEIEIIFLMGIGIILTLGVNIRFILVMNDPSGLEKLISKMKEIEKKKMSSISDISNSKTILYGMIKIDKKIDVNDASTRLNISVIEIKNLIYHLVGEGKINGKFQGNLFIFSSDVDAFIESLDENFENWNQKEKSSDGKI